jgi:Rrf2 family protein
MRFSTKTRYGIRAMIEIACANQEVGIFQKDISNNQGISNKYLDQIIHGLKTAGLIANIKGRKSGYILSRKASKISVFDIHNAFEYGICVIDCMANTYNCTRDDECRAKGFWADLNNKITDHFKTTSLLDLLKQKRLIK